MLKKWRYWFLSPAVLGAAFFTSGSAIAQPVILEGDGAALETDPVAETDAAATQVTSVSQLSDVQPTDWAFEALQNLVERYGCVAGYTDGTYRGSRAMTRYEFAAGLNACLDKISQLIRGNQADLPLKDDLAILQRLQKEFAAELAALRGRVDALEARALELEANQFSATTQLRGETIFALSAIAGDEKADGSGEEIDENVVLSDRLRFIFNTSFTGKDLLLFLLEARNTVSFDAAGLDRINVTGTDMTRASVDVSNNNRLELAKVLYRFPLGKKTTVEIDAVGAAFGESAQNFNTLLSGTGNGVLSRFGRFNPLYRQGVLGSGIIISHNFSPALGVSLAYLADEGRDSTPKRGLFNGSYAAYAQLAFQPSKALNIGLTYVQAYDRSGNVNVTGFTGSALARRPFGNETATFANHYGLQANFAVSPTFNLAGWVGLTEAEAKSGANRGDNATIFNWAVTLAFPDLIQKGNLGGIVVGMPPKVTESDASEDADTSWHLEAFYRWQVTDNIAITPGFWVILNPEHNSANNPIYVGTIRTTFKF